MDADLTRLHVHLFLKKNHQQHEINLKVNLFVVVLSRVSSWNNATHSKNVIVV